jgi:hypothetical protein
MRPFDTSDGPVGSELHYHRLGNPRSRAASTGEPHAPAQALGDQIRAGALPAGPSGDPGQAGALRQELDSAVGDDQAASEGEVGADALIAALPSRAWVVRCGRPARPRVEDWSYRV